MLRCALIVVVLVAATTADYRESSDAFHDVLHFVNGPFSDKSVLDEANLDEIYHEMFEKAECEEKTSNCSQVFFILLAYQSLFYPMVFSVFYPLKPVSYLVVILRTVVI